MLAVKQRVRITGLVARPDLNGKEGLAPAFNVATAANKAGAPLLACLESLRADAPPLPPAVTAGWSCCGCCAGGSARCLRSACYALRSCPSRSAACPRPGRHRRRPARAPACRGSRGAAALPDTSSIKGVIIIKSPAHFIKMISQDAFKTTRANSYYTQHAFGLSQGLPQRLTSLG